MSLLDDALLDIKQDEAQRALRSTRIGTKQGEADSIQSAIAQANAKAAEWRARSASGNNFSSFTDGGYLVQVLAQRCQSCKAVNETLIGIFHCELHSSGSRRLTRLDPRAQLPVTASGRKLEYTEQLVPACVNCLMAAPWGFDDIVLPFSGRTIKHEG